MKFVTINIVNKEFPTVRGRLFTYAGLRLVVAKHYLNEKWWSVYEFSTGLKASRKSEPTQSGTIDVFLKELDRYGSLEICKALNVAITNSGIINIRS